MLKYIFYLLKHNSLMLLFSEVKKEVKTQDGSSLFYASFTYVVC